MRESSFADLTDSEPVRGTNVAGRLGRRRRDLRAFASRESRGMSFVRSPGSSGTACGLPRNWSRTVGIPAQQTQLRSGLRAGRDRAARPRRSSHIAARRVFHELGRQHRIRQLVRRHVCQQERLDHAHLVGEQPPDIRLRANDMRDTVPGTVGWRASFHPALRNARSRNDWVFERLCRPEVALQSSRHSNPHTPRHPPSESCATTGRRASALARS